MSIIIANAPPQGQNVVQAGVNTLMNMNSETRRAMSEGIRRSQGVTIAAPHPIYTCGLDAVLAGTLAEAAQLSGWRYILLDNDDALAAAEVTPAQGQKEAEFSGINRGIFVGNMVRGVGIAEELEAVRAKDYELRLLNIPSIYTVAIWLHGDEDIFILLPPAPAQVKPYSPYSTNELLEMLLGPALKRRSFDDEAAIVSTETDQQGYDRLNPSKLPGGNRDGG